MTTLDKLKALLDSFEAAEHLYQQHSAAYGFAQYGRGLLRVVEAAKETIESFNGDGPIKLNRLEQALAASEEEV